jgi:mannose-6-phosphate isomerase
LGAEAVDGRAPLIYKGVKPGVTRESFESHIRDGTVVNDLVAVAAVPGECHNLPSGTVHALGEGVLVAEVQTPSDTTFRVFDWGRTGRELHVAQALECIDFGPAPRATSLPKGRLSGRLVNTEFFQVQEHALPAGGVVPLAESGPHVLIVLKGAVALKGEESESAGIGATVLVPAAGVPKTTVLARPGAQLLSVSLS